MTNLNISLVNCPTESGQYRFIQFASGDEIYFRFEPSPLYGAHEDILLGFAGEVGIECRKIPRNDREIAALPENIEYELVGAGLCNVDLENRTVTYFGNSVDYQIGINKDHLQRLQTEFPDWKIHPRTKPSLIDRLLGLFNLR
tara:strand:- start:1358 stop:1786 length:429 start_codon:yes stop_codon:yes gene_type:complete